MQNQTKHHIIEHCSKHPQLQISDLFKYIYQSAFGCEHLVTSFERALAYIESEYQTAKFTDGDEIESLDGDYSRVCLSIINKGISAKTLAKIFVNSSKTEIHGAERLQEKISVAKELVSEGSLPFTTSDFEQELSNWKSLGYPAIHHSIDYKNAYYPAYRVISNRYVPYLTLFARIDVALKCHDVNTLKNLFDSQLCNKDLLNEIYGNIQIN